jgi:hypothetical protein
MHSHLDHKEQNELVINVFSQMAKEKNKSLEKIKKLFLIKQNNAIINRFWEILEEIMPGHPYQYVGCCSECGCFKLRIDSPF